MSSGSFVLYRTAAVVLFVFAAHWAYATQPGKATVPHSIETLGKETFTLNGPWQFHNGDDPTWAGPTFDSSSWEQLSADQPWGNQGHAQLTGFAWYRCFVGINRANGETRDLSLLVPEIHDSYEVYWNGSLIGHNGKLPPRPIWYSSQPEQTFTLGPVQNGILAVRVWKAPLLSDDSGNLGGFDAAPLIGTTEAIATAKAAHEFHWLRSRQLQFGTNLLCAVIALLSFLLWVRAPGRRFLFWTSGFAGAQPIILLLVNAHLAFPYPVAMGAAQPLSAMQDVSLWFLLLWLFSLNHNRTLCRITQVLAYIYITSEALDGVLVAFSWNPHWTALAQVSDTALTILVFPIEAFPLILLGYALFTRKQFDSARWLVALLALLDEMMLLFSYAVKQGRQFTGWAIADKIDSPLFFRAGNSISLSTLAGGLLLAAIIYAVYNSVREDQRRKDALEREMMKLLHESERLRYHAEHDGLTGLLNRRITVDRLGEEMIRSRRDGTPLSVIVADVDHFKKINDTFGHQAGDLVLQEIGRVFTNALRSYDFVGRYGGEEFLIILPNCEMESALDRAEQLRVAVQKASIMDGEKLLQVTASFGLTAYLPSHDASETVLRAADAALYRAKSCGRNCVIQA